MNGHFTNEFSRARARSATQGVLFLFTLPVQISPVIGSIRNILLILASQFSGVLCKSKDGLSESSRHSSVFASSVGEYKHATTSGISPRDSGDHSHAIMLAKESFYRLGSVSRHCMMFLRLFLPLVHPGPREATVLFG